MRRCQPLLQNLVRRTKSDCGRALSQIGRLLKTTFNAAVRLESGVMDIRARPMWNPGWTATVRIRFDADILSLKDVYNLLYRAGLQVGILEGRPDSSKSVGQGWGTFDLISEPEEE